jgi:Ion channel
MNLVYSFLVSVGILVDPSSSINATILAQENRLSRLHFLITFVGLAGLGVAVAAAQIVSATSVGALTINSTTNILKIVSTILTFFLLVFIALKYRVILRINRFKGLILPRESFIETSFFRAFLLELIICGIHCPLYVYGSFSYDFMGTAFFLTYDEVISVVEFLRLYLLVLLLTDSLNIQGQYASAVARWHNVELDIWFTLKLILQKYSLAILSLGYLTVVLTLAYAMMVFERSNDMYAFYDYDVALWNILITSLTVGYGDTWPASPPGRVIAVIAAISGILITTLTTATLTNKTSFSEDENKFMTSLLVDSVKRKRKYAALDVVMHAVKLWLYLHRSGALKRRHHLKTASSATVTAQVPSIFTVQNPSRKDASPESSSLSNEVSSELMRVHGLAESTHTSSKSIRVLKKISHTPFYVYLVPNHVYHEFTWSLQRWRVHQRKFRKLGSKLDESDSEKFFNEMKMKLEEVREENKDLKRMLGLIIHKLDTKKVE